jgi:hypothetical protein
MKAKLLGYRKSESHKPAGSEEYQDHDEGDVTYKFYIELDNKFYSFEAIYSYGSCGSGYCGASWGNIENKLNKENNIPNLTEPNKELFIEINDSLEVIQSLLDSEEPWDATTTTIKSTEGDIIVSGTGDGGCSYYSSGVINLNEELFK